MSLLVLGLALLLLCASCSETNECNSLPTTCPSDICVAMDNSVGLTQEQFDRQKAYLLGVFGALAQTTDSSVQVVAYSSQNTLLVPSTQNTTMAVNAVTNLTYIGDPFSILGSPIVYCDAQLRHEPGSVQASSRNKVILMFTGGLTNLGGDPVPRANVFRDRAGGKILVVSLNGKNVRVLRQIAGSSRNFITVLNDTSVLDNPSNQKSIDLVRNIC